MAKSNKETPLMKQYNGIKAKYPGTILFFRLGDFFETFNEDAEITAKICGITLTKRNNGAAGEMPLAGFPHHQLDNYLPKLVRAGYRVAVCEQVEDPKKAKGIVKRDVVEVVTPGVALYDKILDSKKNNFILSLNHFSDKSSSDLFGVSYADISTGEFYVSEVPHNSIVELIESINPSEILINKEQISNVKQVLNSLSFEPALTKLEEWIYDYEFSKDNLLKTFETKTLKGFGIENMNLGIVAAGVIINYISETQKSSLPQFKKVTVFNISNHMILDYPTRKNLEITFDNTGSKEGSLFGVIDQTVTPMGGRLLKKWVSHPLIKKSSIDYRANKVESLFNNVSTYNNLRDRLKKISDLERINVKLATSRINPRDLIALKLAFEQIPDLKDLLSSIEMGDQIDDFPNLEDLRITIENSINDDAPANIGNGNVFKRNFNTELDEYVEAKYSGKNWINDFQERERERTGISSLKVGYNNVFGYYIDITRTHSDKVPEEYQRRQSLRNSERYITPELKEFEEKILGAEEKIFHLENKLFDELKTMLLVHIDSIKKFSDALSELDSLQSLASVSLSNNFTKPILSDSKILKIKNGRHPVIENNLDIGESFTPNDLIIGENDDLHIITGPNMSGKSCYLRQNALIILLAQIGSFVPADSAEIGIVDRIFTRVGAQDNINKGESTFLVEMQEAANIVNNSTDRSFILLDEVGRGTATFDGLSIAWALSEFIHEKIQAKTLFATHYHELNDLENRFKGIKNYRVEVIESAGKIIFTHKVKEGGSDHSFGIHVAQMAGLPELLTNRANEILKTFESGSDQGKMIDNITSKPNTSNISKKTDTIDDQLAIFQIEDDKIRQKLKEINIERISPIEAFQLLHDLVKEVRS